PFIVMDDCSVPPKNIDPDEAVRTKEFELASKAAEELKQMQFPSNMQRVQEVLVNAVSVLDLASHSSE
ncbi:hypothetical protein HZA99_05395, partial [Candidatus Woesearchaeota archaeon]|nr:hypothetical protein [Candidatus Woesearchaeota archaeon]